jgi:5'(3')-deoxyribonucleotidase
MKHLCQVYVDMDGVLADFDKRAIELLGMLGQEYEDTHGPEAFWTELWVKDHEFYLNLEPMPGAQWLWDNVTKLTYPGHPKILTGCPKEEDSKRQKIAWAKKNFPEADVITCKSREKCHHCKPGDVLIDDFTKYKHLWEKHKGKFIHHTNNEQSIAELQAYLNSL